mmetsp:Transcript_31309/g.104019  ORF Transcript_31309/g.104019 Transcript_31309/m.104019 type:complete len:109 (+) Transcript_31309:118-444(+)
MASDELGVADLPGQGWQARVLLISTSWDTFSPGAAELDLHVLGGSWRWERKRKGSSSCMLGHSVHVDLLTALIMRMCWQLVTRPWTLLLLGVSTCSTFVVLDLAVSWR